MDNLDLNIKAIDLEKSAAGVWIEYDGDISFLIARSNSPEYRTAVRKMHKQYKFQIERETLSDAKSDTLMANLIARHVLLDWKGLMNGGKDWKYSVEGAAEMLADTRYAELREWVMMQADDLENFRSEAVKKLKVSS